MFGANVHHVPRLCVLGIGGAPYISLQIMAQKPYSTFLTSSLKLPADGGSYYVQMVAPPWLSANY